MSISYFLFNIFTYPLSILAENNLYFVHHLKTLPNLFFYLTKPVNLNSLKLAENLCFSVVALLWWFQCSGFSVVLLVQWFQCSAFSVVVLMNVLVQLSVVMFIIGKLSSLVMYQDMSDIFFSLSLLNSRFNQYKVLMAGSRGNVL